MSLEHNNQPEAVENESIFLVDDPEFKNCIEEALQETDYELMIRTDQKYGDENDYWGRRNDEITLTIAKAIFKNDKTRRQVFPDTIKTEEELEDYLVKDGRNQRLLDKYIHLTLAVSLQSKNKHKKYLYDYIGKRIGNMLKSRLTKLIEIFIKPQTELSTEEINIKQKIIEVDWAPMLKLVLIQHLHQLDCYKLFKSFVLRDIKSDDDEKAQQEIQDMIEIVFKYPEIQQAIQELMSKITEYQSIIKAQNHTNNSEYKKAKTPEPVTAVALAAPLDQTTDSQPESEGHGRKRRITIKGFPQKMPQILTGREVEEVFDGPRKNFSPDATNENPLVNEPQPLPAPAAEIPEAVELVGDEDFEEEPTEQRGSLSSALNGNLIIKADKSVPSEAAEEKEEKNKFPIENYIKILWLLRHGFLLLLQ
ncbi:hypothetical protein JW911_04865 [Candidatus Peregrinibacteria bacterium]|nr:hypothetical protein [Candidatus Peregrinibacteria bacterium]